MALLKDESTVAYLEWTDWIALGNREGGCTSVDFVKDFVQDSRRTPEHSRERTCLLIA